MGTRAPSIAHPCRATKIVTMVSRVIPCKGSRGCAMVCGGFTDDIGMRKCRVPIADEFHKCLGGSGGRARVSVKAWEVQPASSLSRLGHASTSRSQQHCKTLLGHLVLCILTITSSAPQLLESSRPSILVAHGLPLPDENGQCVV